MPLIISENQNKIHPRQEGQGSLEYLLLISGAILVTITVLIILQTITPSNLISDNLNTYNQISLGLGFNGSSGDTIPPDISNFSFSRRIPAPVLPFPTQTVPRLPFQGGWRDRYHARRTQKCLIKIE